jgi:DNA-binding transcriptional MerR regulator
VEPTAGSDPDQLTIDELASATGTTARRVRSLQTLGLLPHPELRGRTGLYGPLHQERLAAILDLQDRGFSLESLGVLFAALDEGRSLAAVLGLDAPPTTDLSASSGPETSVDTAELYGFADLEPARASRRRARQPLLSLVPTTMWDESEAS